MNYLEIQALDTLFFRDGKPFTMGSDTYGSGMFPPPVSVLRGFVRTLHFAGKGGDTSVAGETTDTSVAIRISHFALKKNNEWLYPLPLDIWKPKSSGNIEKLKIEMTDGLSSALTPCILSTAINDKASETKNLYLKRSDLADYLYQGDCSGLTPDDIKEYLHDEVKLGIGRDDASRTASDTGRLYRIQMKRPESKKGDSLSLVTAYENEVAHNGLSRIGGEGKIARYQILDSPSPIPAPDNLATGYCKMYLLTPGIFTSGWYPKDLFVQHEIEVLAAATGRYENYGGWDVVKKQPKPMFRAIPSGSVFYLKASSSVLSAFVNQFHGKALEHSTEIPNSLHLDGFGIVCFGNLSQQDISTLQQL